MVINSGYRNPAYNAGVGGVEFSRHQWGDAADISISGLTREEIALRCEDEGVSYVGWYEAHIHCDWRDDSLSAPFYGAMVRGGLLQARPKTSTLLRDGDRWTAPATGWDEGEPLREWRAFSADGREVMRAEGRSFVAPADAERVEVVVGREIVATAWVAPRP
jgi:hypothetical protein